jgi:hypothetical protein
MLHGFSLDPIHIKKIPIRIWSLQKEIHLFISEHIDSLSPEDLEHIHSHYHKSPHLKDELKKLFIQNLLAEYHPNHLPHYIQKILAQDPKSATSIDKHLKLVPPIQTEENIEKSEQTTPDQEPLASTEASKSLEAEVKSEPEDLSFSIIEQRYPRLQPEDISHGKVLISEVSINDILFFSEKAFFPGETIIIHFCLPESFSITLEILDIHNYTHQSQIYSIRPMPYRIYARTLFLRHGERSVLREFLLSAEPPNYSSVELLKLASEREQNAPNDSLKSNTLQKKEDGDENDLDDLENLDL